MEFETQFGVILLGCVAKHKIDRDRAINDLSILCENADQTQHDRLIDHFVSLLTPNGAPVANDIQLDDWETKTGSLSAIKSILKTSSSSHVVALSYERYSQLRLICERHFRHVEARVRGAAADLVREIVQFSALDERFLTNELPCWSALIGEELRAAMAVYDSKSDDVSSAVANNNNNGVEVERGWRTIETYCMALQRLCDGLVSNEAYPTVQKEVVVMLAPLLTDVVACVTHNNRFVREGVFLTAAAVCKLYGEPIYIKWEDDATMALRDVLYTGVKDNWSQVRYSAVECLSSFTKALDISTVSSYRDVLVSQFGPPLLLNRFYVAAGVRNVSTAVWHDMLCLYYDCRSQPTTEQSFAVITLFADAAVTFYMRELAADNHAVREAACAALGELSAALVDEKQRDNSADLRVKIEARLPELLTALLECRLDESWPVREAACTSVTQLSQAFAESTGEEDHRRIIGFVLANVVDPIAFVRTNAASSAYRCGDKNVDTFLEFFDEHIADAVNGTEKDADIVTSANISVNDAATVNDEDDAQLSVLRYDVVTPSGALQQHTIASSAYADDQQYSCGSLAPKMKSGGARSLVGGCSAGHGFTRSSLSWERSAGCVLLLLELTPLIWQMDSSTASQRGPMVTAPKAILERLGRIESVLGDVTEEAGRHGILIAFCDGIALLAERFSSDKRKMKPILEPCFNVLAKGLNTTASTDASLVPAVRNALARCFGMLAKVLGPNILKGRLENHNCASVLTAYKASTM